LKSFKGTGTLRIWENERFRTKYYAMGQNDRFSNSSTCTYENVFLSVLQRDSKTSPFQVSSAEICSEKSQTHV